jgi:hypothetical protein
MTTSSVPKDYLTTSSDTISVSTLPVGNVTIGGTGSSYYSNSSAGTITFNVSNSGSGYTLGNGITLSGLSNTTISPITIDQINSYSGFNVPEEWEGRFPDWGRIQLMCEEYPGLKIAYEKFKTTYKLVKDHYDTPEDQRPLP